MPTLEYGSDTLHYHQWGDTGSPVIFVHGSCGGGGQWKALATMLSDEFRCICPDNPSVGGSGPWPDDRIWSFADDEVALKALLTEIGEPVHLVMHSGGGHFAYPLIRDHTDQLLSLSFFEPVYFQLLRQADDPRFAEPAGMVDRYRAFRDSGRYDEALEDFVDTWAKQPGAWASLPEAIKEQMRAGGARLYHEWDAPWFDSPNRQQLADLTVPVLLFMGKSTIDSMQGVCEIMCEVIPGCTFVEIDGAGHMSPFTHAKIAEPALRQFLRAAEARREESLDPADWQVTRQIAHRMVDEAIDRLAQVRSRPVWRPLPDEVRARFQPGLPQNPASLEQVYDDYQENVGAYSMGNIHPRFWGWYMGASNFTGALGDFLAAIEGTNVGGGATGAAQVEEQVINWLKEIVGFPASASGTLTSGGSVANLIAHTVIRNLAAGYDVRQDGVAGLAKPLRFYISDQGHSCHQKALEILGLGAKAIVEIETDSSQRMRMDALQAAIAQDRENGLQPACVIGTAGTTNTGAIDDLNAIADLCAREGLWFHVDGCIGGVLRLSPEHAGLVAGVERAGSVAIDPHKWLHTPFDAGAVLIKDPDAHFETFEMHGPYLQLQTRGMFAGKFLADYGLQLTRGFRALKIWMAFKEHGAAKFGRLIAQDMAFARYLADRVEAHPKLELLTPVTTNIVFFRHIAADEEAAKALNAEIMLRLQERGLAMPSDTTVQGKYGLRCAFNNHRTRRDDIDGFLSDLLRIAEEILAEQAD